MTSIRRTTKETAIEVTLDLGTTLENVSGASECFSSRLGNFSGTSGIGFFDHMLKTLAFYAELDLTLNMSGDLDVDQHHSLEDLGLLLGLCLKTALDAEPDVKRRRYAHCYLPMDECLVRVVLDLGGRPYLVCQLPPLKERVGQFETETLPEFLRAFAQGAQLTLHIEGLYGTNTHHMIEALFKGLGLCLKTALAIEDKGSGPNSTKGLID